MVILCNQPYTKCLYDSHFELYPFLLSDFQKYAIEGILEGHHVLVTAHTGSGKTLPAEFAIDYFHRQGKKVIYTSPIKALSNQKFYDFTQKFPHIQFGLFTGDIKTNPEADVLIMTTEILMNTLFNKTMDQDVRATTEMQFQIDFDTELAAVVFDEIHYINDVDRGQVWEKSILMLPPHIQMIMLSATIDDPERFARWCEEKPNSTKEVYLSSTNHRVVPLTHYVYLAASESTLKSIKDKQQQQMVRKYCNEIHCIQNEKGVFQQPAHKELVRVNDTLISYKINSKRKYVLNEMGKYLRDHDMLPAIGFVFSRKQVEQCVREITTPLLEEDSKIPYLVRKECDQILRRLSNYEEYIRLPEYIQLTEWLEKGVAIHHSGMIPILREIVELCITKKYIKWLFATESFAIGLDCPIKTALFLSVTKFDGSMDRVLYSHEYTQMAGRAGRRGIDTVGHVVHCCNLFKPPSESAYKELMCGKPPKLVSKYKISYDMVLNVIHAYKKTTLSTIVQFTNRSMMYEEVEREKKQQKDLLASLEGNQPSYFGVTPKDICREYCGLQAQSKVMGNKKKKECLRKLKEIETEYVSVSKDLLSWKESEKMIKKQKDECAYLSHLDNYIYSKTQCIYDILKTCRFVESISTTETVKTDEIVQLTEIGTIASHMAEVDSIIWSVCVFEKWQYLKNFNVKQIVGLFSCATDIKVNPESRKEMPQTEDGFLREKLQTMKAMYDEQAKMEDDAGIVSGISYDHPMVFDIVDESMLWCDCESEEQCKLFISEHLNTKDIALGDFTKAMMKIASIAREMQSIGELEICKIEVEWLHKMSQIEDMVLKYIATNQSLYV